MNDYWPLLRIQVVADASLMPQMDVIETVVGLPFAVIRAPKLKLRIPVPALPERMTVFALIMVTYFLFTGGLIYGS